MAPCIFFQPLSLSLAYLGFSKQCKQCGPQDSWCCEQDDHQHNRHSQQDTQQVGKPEAPLDGGSQWPADSKWYCVSLTLLAWAPGEDWEAVDRSPNSAEKALEVVSSFLPNKAPCTAVGTVGWIFLTALKVNMVLVTLGHRAVAVQSLSCNPMDWSRPGFLVLHQLLEFAQTHIHWIGDAIQPSHPLSSPSPPAFKLPQPKDLFQ